MSCKYALLKRTHRQFVVERTKKLLIPFFFGLLALVPVMTYTAEVFFNGYTGTYWQQYDFISLLYNYGKLQQFANNRSKEKRMETVKRDLYLNRLIERRENGLIKVVTGIRRCGKSYLILSRKTDELNSRYLIDLCREL